MIKLTIDGQEITTRAGNTILAAAQEGGISIPTLCYHESLLPIGSCRLCVVEVEGYEKPMTACTTPAVEGISVITKSDRLFRMRREFLKLILTCHPLDCPQCDKGGECRLQDLVREHGIEKAEYEAVREDHKDIYATPLIRYWELRCVLCGRCYRACREISGRAAIDLTGKGFQARIAATENNDCISCGECLSLCPVGALTENLSPVKSRVWQSTRTDTTCPHCGFGCRLTLDVLDEKFISKVISAPDAPPNHGSLCVRGRFGYDFANHDARLTEPCLVEAGVKKTLDREAALQIAAEKLRRLDEQGKGLGFLVSPRSTNEELFLIARLAERFRKVRIASSAFYHTGRVDAACRSMGITPTYSYDNLLNCETIIIAGADLLLNNHLLANKVREAVKLVGTRIIVVDPLPNSLAGIADAHLQVTPGQDAGLFNTFSRWLLQDGKYAPEAAAQEGFPAFRAALTAQDDNASAPGGAAAETVDKAYTLIKDATNIGVVFSSGITGNAASLTALLNFCLLKDLHRKGLIMATALQANARGTVSILSNLVSPDELLLDDELAGIFIYEDDPYQYLNGDTVKNALDKKEFLALCDVLPTAVMAGAQLILPAATFAEKEGTFISGDGRVRQVNQACQAKASGHDFLRDLLHRLGGKFYGDQNEIKSALRQSGLLQGNGAGGLMPPAAGKARFAALHSPLSEDRLSQARQVLEGAERPYRLILRDIFINHHLTATYAPGIARVQRDLLNIAPEDAAALNLADGENLYIESDNGAVTRPVTIKAGLRQGVLEGVLFQKRREMLALSLKPAKVIAVSVRKA